MLIFRDRGRNPPRWPAPRTGVHCFGPFEARSPATRRAGRTPGRWSRPIGPPAGVDRGGAVTRGGGTGSRFALPYGPSPEPPGIETTRFMARKKDAPDRTDARHQLAARLRPCGSGITAAGRPGAGAAGRGAGSELVQLRGGGDGAGGGAAWVPWRSPGPSRGGCSPGRDPAVASRDRPRGRRPRRIARPRPRWSRWWPACWGGWPGASCGSAGNSPTTRRGRAEPGRRRPARPGPASGRDAIGRRGGGGRRRQGVPLELAGPLAGQPQALADLGQRQRPGRQAEPQPEDPGLAAVQPPQPARQPAALLGLGQRLPSGRRRRPGPPRRPPAPVPPGGPGRRPRAARASPATAACSGQPQGPRHLGSGDPRRRPPGPPRRAATGPAGSWHVGRQRAASSRRPASPTASTA